MGRFAIASGISSRRLPGSQSARPVTALGEAGEVNAGRKVHGRQSRALGPLLDGIKVYWHRSSWHHSHDRQNLKILGWFVC
jgi:hypothetical protein